MCSNMNEISVVEFASKGCSSGIIYTSILSVDITETGYIFNRARLNTRLVLFDTLLNWSPVFVITALNVIIFCKILLINRVFCFVFR